MDFIIEDPISWTVETNGMWTMNTWFHFIFTHQFNLTLTNVIFFKNGVQEHTDSTVYEYADNSNWPVVIGCEMNPPSALENSFNGYLYDYIIHNYALTQGEVSSTFTTPCSG